MNFYEQSTGKAIWRSATFEAAGRKEIHITVVPDTGRVGDSIEDQLRCLADTLRDIVTQYGAVPVFKRIFLSDVANQADIVRSIFDGMPGVLSIIGQPPLFSPGIKAALLAIALVLPDSCVSNASVTTVVRGPYTDLWVASLCGAPGEESGPATESIFSRYQSILANHGMSLRDNCMRTWFYVRDIDNRYGGMVTARNKAFSHSGLTRETHFIASTGIEGTGPTKHSVVTFDALAVKGLQPAQIRYINARTHLNPTSEYGVAFERATAIDYGDRRILYISGTASINDRGQIVAEGDIVGQTRRMTENVRALLQVGECKPSDLSHILLYIRDIADRQTATRIVEDSFPGVPIICVAAAVCRPGWLVEMECMAIKKMSHPSFAPY